MVRCNTNRYSMISLLLGLGLSVIVLTALNNSAGTAAAHNEAIAWQPTSLTLRAGTAPTIYLPLALKSGIWQPALNTSWQLQFTALPIDQSVNAEMYDIDLFDNDASVVAALRAQGRKVVCYVNVGAWEDWRSDAADFPPEVLGNDYAGWPGEKWLDIRRIDLLGPIMRNRLDLCKTKGFDAIDPDNVNGYANDTGFPLTYQDQVTYNVWLANEAHARGLSIGLKNDSEQIAELLSSFDWTLLESCFEQGWCNQATPFITAGKAVFAIEYTDTGITTTQFCPQANAMNFNAILKHRELDAWRQACR